MEEPEKKQLHPVDDDLYEDIDDEEMYELVWEAQREALLKEKLEKSNPAPKRRFPKWIIWAIAITMAFNTFSIVFQLYSIPAIDFLMTSAKLSTDKDISSFKKSVVVVSTEGSKGTGFSISSEGTIITNYHVVKENKTVSVIFPDEGRFMANVIHANPSVDLAVLEVNGNDLPHLELAEETQFSPNEPIRFIGNPLSFHGIANEGTILDYTKLKTWEDEVIMIKAPVYRGNSGSPIINKDGQVIGVIFATLDHDDHGTVGLFVPIDYYYRMLE